MSEMNTMPVYRCRRCGNLVVVTSLSTTIPDPTGEILMSLMKSLGNAALCPNCQKAYNYYAKENRMEDFYAAPTGKLLSVHDWRARRDL